LIYSPSEGYIVRHGPNRAICFYCCWTAAKHKQQKEKYTRFSKLVESYKLNAQKILRDENDLKKLRALDLYSGIGGWSLGLKMAGIDVVRSYEWWPSAADTHRKNLGDSVELEDIRELKASSLPDGINVVVGSPPCTQFSYANRGGGGDISEGLKDIRKFLEIVEYISPDFWVMENVPRVASILERELSVGGQLEGFRPLVKNIEIFDCSEFGLPQRRKRMLAGNFQVDLLKSYRDFAPQRALEDVKFALACEEVADPIYGLKLPAELVTDNEYEDNLDIEELRLNREAKQYHRIYNVMPFPEPEQRASRTITAAETRVSRESLIVTADNPEGYRRLSLRERASLQGFPITYQFYGSSYSDRQKAIGNAIPPLLTYLIGRAFAGTPAEIVHSMQLDYEHDLPEILPKRVKRRVAAVRHRPDRRFRSAIPSLRFGSGVRFELANRFASNDVLWEVLFYFGGSKNYRCIKPDSSLCEKLLSALDENTHKEFVGERERFELALGRSRPSKVQNSWNHTNITSVGPYEVSDVLGKTAMRLSSRLLKADQRAAEVTESAIAAALNGDSDSLVFPPSKKNKRIFGQVFLGMIIGAWFNSLDLAKPAPHAKYEEINSKRNPK